MISSQRFEPLQLTIDDSIVNQVGDGIEACASASFARGKGTLIVGVERTVL